MTHDPSTLLAVAGIRLPLVGFYDAPDPGPFAPVIEPATATNVCVFAFFKRWLEGKTLHLTKERFGCGGAGRALCGVMTRSREAHVRFLVDEEGLKASHALMEEWLDHSPPYKQQHEHLLIGPLRPEHHRHLRTVTFWVTPDQLGLLALGAQYNVGSASPPPVLAPFGSGCMQLVTVFENLDRPQATIGATDIAMRQYLPPDVLAFTVTRPLFEQLCALDERSFLHKAFWKRLQAARTQV